MSVTMTTMTMTMMTVTTMSSTSFPPSHSFLMNCPFRVLSLSKTWSHMLSARPGSKPFTRFTRGEPTPVNGRTTVATSKVGNTTHPLDMATIPHHTISVPTQPINSCTPTLISLNTNMPSPTTLSTPILPLPLPTIVAVISLEGRGGRPEQDCGPTTTTPSNATAAGLGSTAELWPNDGASSSHDDSNPTIASSSSLSTNPGGLSLAHPESLADRRTSDGTMASNNNNNNRNSNNTPSNANPRNSASTASSPVPVHAPLLEPHSPNKASQRSAKGSMSSSSSSANAKKASERARARWAVVRSNLKQVIALKEELNKFSSITDRRKRLEKIAVVDDATVKELQLEILGELGVGEHVGSHAFLRNAPHAFSVIATQPCRFYTLQLTGR